ncbi:NtaA/DmoA family FMN-dependent monooxygenase [Arthrobacter sp. zg-Y820]|uniref:NtaA/DmoA family FMN-dependent monooxygenase n=1 Tax=unclassified Arthrobacter TaxID=235627 RepID=UPI001E317896|nr:MULTISPECIES: NtaA/DmoA family FMN-dependent monooxygenase [unclassified Arthrobacter]MCC9196844.1 NtaA/DmoA family FMN-dependent monooxygenase [Arthrobacter sp. zg-Y820]MDK1279707.1 NtaA/DmoA family FMN-dependent monooxygenase [Arthrobacter sp. zg.Y820]WIB07924.1 NtaA/DmoA family FMN-dependent monooxygenase [Arthrobacter sp. zg-Y820]
MTKRTLKSQRAMILGMHLNNGYGSQPSAWRMPGVDPSNYTSYDALVRYAQAAERGKVAFLFLPDTPALTSDVNHDAPQMTLDPMMALAAIARGTERIGLVATGSTTFNEPYNIARQFKALDVLSHGRAGWNAVTTSDPSAAANFGQEIAPRPERYQRAHETIQIAQALWGSWEKDAWTRNKETGRFADASKIRPVDLRGGIVSSRGPLPIPPSEQGQPVIFSAGGGEYGLGLAGRYASGVIGAAFTIEDARAQREAARDAARRSGRNPDEIKYFAGLMPAIGATKRAALDRRLMLGERIFPQRVPYLGSMLGLNLEPSQLDQPLTPHQLAAAQASPFDPRSLRALEVAREGWTIRDILAHGIIDYHPTPVGDATVTADHMQEWFEAEAVDGFWVSVDVYEDGVDTFVDEVVPILQERGLMAADYEGSTLRDHLGVPDQYGLDSRVQ